ncbi:MAG TPA: phosphoribosylformylglycinamidine synthase, partial [Clostridiales bacterium]|nr:phosphoribosylformylglycinamidine synthase [Clostridiales bacterium]
MVRRIYVKKKNGFDIEAKGVLNDLKENLQIKELEDVIVLNRYDVEGVEDSDFDKAKTTIFSEPQVDDYFEDEYNYTGYKVFGIEFLPGQFDQRANSLSECLQILTEGERPTAKTAKIYLLKGNLTDIQVDKIKKYLINPVDSRECSLDKVDTLKDKLQIPEDVDIVEGFINMTDEDCEKFYKKYGFAMDIKDLK